MKVTNRQRRILEELLNRQGEVTAGRLAQELLVSARTIHRELQELEPMLAASGLELVKKSGIGIFLAGPDPQLARFRKELRQSETETYSPDERKVLILCRLLEEDEPVKLFALAREVQAAIPTVSRDLDEMERELQRYGLELVRKRGYGVEIAGSESAKRQFIAWIAREHLDPSDWFAATGERAEPWPAARRLLEMLGDDTFLRVDQALWQQAEQWLKGLREADYTRLLIHVTVAVARNRSGHRMEAGEADLKVHAGMNQEDEAEGGPVVDLERFAHAMELDLSPVEAAYLHRLFAEAKAQSAKAAPSIMEHKGLELAEQTMKFIQSAERMLNVKLSNDRSLLDGLIHHLGPALERIRQGESIRNPLLQQIRKDYEALFAAIKQCAGETWTDLAIPDEEIGYLTMHFGAALERWMLTPKGIKALLVCTSGIGSSKLLAVRLTKEFPQIDLIGLFPWYEASRVPEDRYDLIISTVDLPVEPNRYIKLSPFLTAEEADKLRDRIRTIASSAASDAAEKEDYRRFAWERMKRSAKYYSAAAEVLESFNIHVLDNGSGEQDLERLLTDMIGKLPPAAFAGPAEDVVQALADREAQGSVLIPDSELALFHSRSSRLRQPLLALFRLRVPLKKEGRAEGQIRQILLMLAPQTLGKETLEVLSEISALLLAPVLIRLLTEGDKESVRAYLSQHLETYMKNNLDWREAR